ncbi:MAG: tetratricopeptide repeat protein [Polyangiaceae bacterium]|nr:tetratricopeptide repeat protein [Polyangiaceae bacterium]
MGLSDRADHSDRLVCGNCHGQYEIETVAGTRRKVLRCGTCDATEEVWIVPARKDAWTAISPLGLVTRHASWLELTATTEPTDNVHANDKTFEAACDLPQVDSTPPTPDVNARSATSPARRPLRPLPPRPAPQRPSIIEDATPDLPPTPPAKISLAPTPRTMTSAATPPIETSSESVFDSRRERIEARAEREEPAQAYVVVRAQAPQRPTDVSIRAAGCRTRSEIPTDTPREALATPPLPAMISAEAKQAEATHVPLPPPSITVPDDSLPVLPSTRASSRPAQESLHLEFEEHRARRPWLVPVGAIGAAVCAFYIIRNMGESPAPETRMMAATASAMPVVPVATAALDTHPVASADPVASVAPMESPSPSTAEGIDPSSTIAPSNKIVGSPTKKQAVHSLPKLLDQARAARSAGNLSSARELYERALDEHPDNVEAFAGLGDVAHQQGDLDLATREYERALSLAPRYMPALLGAADALWDLGEHEAATEHYLTVLELSKTPPARVKERALGGEDNAPSDTATAVPATPKAAKKQATGEPDVEDESTDTDQ